MFNQIVPRLLVSGWKISFYEQCNSAKFLEIDKYNKSCDN